MLNNMIKIRVGNEEKEVKEYTRVKDCLKDDKKEILAVKVNNSLHSIYYKLIENSYIEPITFHSDEGKRIYERTLKFIFLKACYKLKFDLNKIDFINKFQNVYFVKFEQEVNEELVISLKKEMWNIIKKDIAITKIKVSYANAVKICRSVGCEHQLDNFRIKIKDRYTFYECDSFYNYLYGLLAPSTGYIKNFDLMYSSRSILLCLPNDNDINTITFHGVSDNIINEFVRFKRFEENIGIGNVSDMNIQVLSDGISNVIRYAESNHERRILQIVNRIDERKDIRIVFVAGPSSSGKTTFSQKLKDELRIIGRKAIHISMDNYFNDLENIPVVNGEKDYESIDNLDIKLFSEQINTLLKGSTVNIPEYNFKVSKKEYKNNILYMAQDDILIIEGIHALNPLIHSLIKEESFKIYLAPFVTLGLDNFTKISSNDTRLIRRLVRDADIRGVNPENTLKKWKKVISAEKKNIFPYINLADEIFNTNLVYELGVLKIFAEKLLLKVSNDNKYFSDARRLYKLLNNFLPIETADIPKKSVIKEFIGNGYFKR